MVAKKQKRVDDKDSGQMVFEFYEAPPAISRIDSLILLPGQVEKPKHEVKLLCSSDISKPALAETGNTTLSKVIVMPWESQDSAS
jgi:hypothetical protein